MYVLFIYTISISIICEWHKQSCSYTFKKELNASTYPIYLFLFQRFECTTLIIKELLLNLLHFIFTIIIKQYYCIKRQLKKLTIVKKKQFSRTNVFIQNGPISFNKQVFFDFKHEFIISVCQNGKLFKRRDIIAI